LLPPADSGACYNTHKLREARQIVHVRQHDGKRRDEVFSPWPGIVFLALRHLQILSAQALRCISGSAPFDLILLKISQFRGIYREIKKLSIHDAPVNVEEFLIFVPSESAEDVSEEPIIFILLIVSFDFTMSEDRPDYFE
jgi:hypothetical protein